MGLEKVKDEIMAQAKERAEEIISEGRKEADSILKDAKSKINEQQKKMEEELKKTKDNIAKKENASSELEVKKMFLEEKKKSIETVFKEARKKLKELKNTQREKHIKKLLDKAMKELDVKYVFCSKKDSKFVKGFKVEEAEILGGIIAENEKRDVRVDYSYETALENIKEKHLQGVGKILFG